MLYVAVTSPQSSSLEEKQDTEKTAGIVIFRESVNFCVCRAGAYTQY